MFRRSRLLVVMIRSGCRPDFLEFHVNQGSNARRKIIPTLNFSSDIPVLPVCISQHFRNLLVRPEMV